MARAEVRDCDDARVHARGDEHLRTDTYRRVITADVAPLPNVKIEGIEVTQGIQTFWRTGVTDNTVSTVAGKDTIVRVYVLADVGGFNNGQVPRIWGTLSVGSTEPVPDQRLAVLHGTQTVGHQPRDDRSHPQLPHPRRHGERDEGLVRLPDRAGTEWHSRPDRFEAHELDMGRRPAIKVRYVKIRDESDPANVIDAPTDDACRATSLRAIDMLPFPVDVAVAHFPT